MGKVNKQNKNNTTKEMGLIESKSLRDEAVNSASIDFLDKLKAIQYLTKDMIVSIEQIANYYEVSKKSVETIIQRNRDEFEEDGMKVLSGEELKKFKSIINAPSNEGASIGTRINSYTILTKRSLLRVGLIMTNCAMTSKIRNYLLNLEEVATAEQKNWATQREVGKIDRNRETSAIQKYILNGNNHGKTYAEYTNMVYLVLFNKTASQMRSERELNKDSQLTRDYLSKEELKLIDEAETIVTALVSLGYRKDYIKEQLENKYRLKLNEK